MNPNYSNNDGHEDVEELKKRVNDLEKQLEARTKSGNWIKVIFTVIAVIFLMLILIGIIQFVSSG
ncbi:hypothetical protein D3C76_98350 [compost metagenome]